MKRTKNVEYPVRGKFTFKNYEHTGRYRSFDSEGCEIKLKGKVVGFINEITSFGKPHPLEGKFRITLMLVKKDIMEDRNPNCPWKNAAMLHTADSLKDAKEFVQKFNDEIQRKFNIYLKTD